MNIYTVTTDTEIARCYPVLRELRPGVTETQFPDRIRAQKQTGYRLACLEERAGIVAVAGFRVGESLAWGRFLYLDDLVTRCSYRSKGYGTLLLSWLKEEALRRGCEQIHLDSGVQRQDAHRFYERQGFVPVGVHFVGDLAP
jgi:GNAT superfamily N-acetyltransferase